MPLPPQSSCVTRDHNDRSGFSGSGCFCAYGRMWNGGVILVPAMNEDMMAAQEAAYYEQQLQLHLCLHRRRSGTAPSVGRSEPSAQWLKA